MPESRTNLEFREFLEALHREKVAMIIVGGFAGVLHGYSYITNDLDICYQRDKQNYKNMVRALRPFKPRLRGPKGEGIPFLFDEKTIQNGMNFTLTTDVGDIDLLGELSGIGGYEQLIQAVKKSDLYGLELNVISLDDLIRAKKAAGRRKDLLHLDELEALKLMIEKNLMPDKD
ncbi:MAG: hypothetical protein HYT76_04725 [Deltaproteobacteria bacterium]|nr:hypothetical protein [Deltaproteobacteria bacterium]